ncbi:MAG TPA: D-glycerate dehydrogenase [Gemmatales bacterium]|nr:D-glycerate dehydrogenase [Gemmatales bacterium]HMP60719.1 D-glycerate dehydrogenase [Gemmatales bacterium]
MARPRVFVTRRLPEVAHQKIDPVCAAEVWPEPLPPPPEVLRAKAAECDGLLSLLTDRIDASFLDACPRLKVVSNFAVGFNNIDVPAATARGICVGNTPGVLTDATADMAFCLLIAAARRVVEGHNYTVAGQWRTWEPLGHLGVDLAGRTLGIVGMGRIGYALAQRCRGGWGMQILYHDRYKNEKAERELLAQQVDLDRLLAESDFVSVHTDLNAETQHLFNAQRFRQMKRTAVFVNTARGPIHCQKDLYEALRDGVIFAAGLDVTDPEPPAPDDPLLKLPNVVVAPHIASATQGTRGAMAEIAADNLLAGLAGQPLRHWVNPEVAERRRQ